MVELDPATLEPRGMPRLLPGFRGFVNLRAMVCADSCRVVAEGLVGRAMKAVSWTPGGPATAIRLPRRTTCTNCSGVIDARADRGRLAVAYSADASQSGYTIGVARGDARGGHLRRVSSVREPTRIGSIGRGVILNSIPFGAFGSDGFAAIAVYTGRSRATVRVAFLPLR